jgi:tetratricopeptide (TPR) repeat protein
MAHELLALAFDDPARGEGSARRFLDTAELPADRAVGHQALAISLREQGRMDAALPHLRTAVASAEQADDADLLAGVLATSGVTLVAAGFTRRGLTQLDRAIALRPTPQALAARAYALVLQSRYEEAYEDNRAALEGFRSDGDVAWEARCLHSLGWTELSWGRLDEAETHTRAAAELFRSAGLDLEALWSEQNVGEVAYARGDLPTALRVFERVAAEYGRLGSSPPYYATVRAQTCLAAGLVDEAVEVVREALTRDDVAPADRAVLELVAATAQLDGDALDAATESARSAARTLRGLGHDWFATRARLVAVRAMVRRGDRGRRLAAEARDVAEALDARRADEAPVALIVASKVDDAAAAALLERASSYRRRGTDLTRASGWLGRALLQGRQADRGGVLRACGRGLDALDDHRRLMGSTELRALATGHGSELAALALRHAASDPRDLLRWSERWRSTALAQAPVTPGDAPVDESLAALRDATRRLSQARVEGEATEDLEKDRARLERLVRAERHQLAGTGVDTERLDVDELVARVGDETLVELVDVDGVLHVLVVHGGRVRRKVAGTTADALAMAGSARFLLRLSARGRPYVPGDLGDRLERTLLGDAVRLLPDGPVVVVPTARLHGVPWAMLPSLAGRAFGVVPSAAQWRRARDPRPRRGAGVTLLAGPGLGTGGAEVPVLARRQPDAVHLTGAAATVEAALAALDGARLAHVAAHGRFRADSPLFSALELADGPLTVHDLERLEVAPHRMVLSACESGVLAPVGADELLGLASALFALGTAGLVCSVAEVNDLATAELMVDLHEHLDRGEDPAAALLALRQAAEGDVVTATATAFVSLGV